MTTEKPVYGIDRVLARWEAGTTRGLPVSVRTLKKWRQQDPTTALQKLIKQVGNQTNLAQQLGVAQRTISVWLAADLPEREPKAPANEVERAVRLAGGQPKMAEDLGVTQQCVSHWVRQGYVPAARAQEIEVCYGVPRVGLINPKLRNALGAGGEL